MAKVKTSEIFNDALAAALKGDKELTRDYLDEYGQLILDKARQIDQLKHEIEMLEGEHTAVCVVLGAKKGSKR